MIVPAYRGIRLRSVAFVISLQTACHDEQVATGLHQSLTIQPYSSRLWHCTHVKSHFTSPQSSMESRRKTASCCQKSMYSNEFHCEVERMAENEALLSAHSGFIYFLNTVFVLLSVECEPILWEWHLSNLKSESFLTISRNFTLKIKTISKEKNSLWEWSVLSYCGERVFFSITEHSKNV
jgi:hypothetical protein